MHLSKVLCILAVIILSINSGVYGLDWPWNWKREDVTCYTTCLAAVGTGAVVATPLAISAAGFGAAGIAAGSLAAKLMSMVGVVKAGSWLAFLQSAGVYGVGTTGKMILASTVSPLCAAICGSSEERQDLKCYTHRIDGMKGLDEYLIRAEQVKNIKQYDISESQFYVKRCILCYMNATKNAKGRDDEIQTVWEASSLKECEIRCIKTDDCGAVYFDGLRCFKFNTKTEPKENTGTDFFFQDMCRVQRYST
ncbi:Hypothetical predicted protein [Mytilus galloprovincialis]|uniref:Apple domain-containing protein n=1 Tax=Mytilus galloprovincialis TaxID=29158 RepID=A0A8B6F3F0_MYTGA|nr:Hypothetical predicted protein [Mytilus galloprovincialis]